MSDWQRELEDRADAAEAAKSTKPKTEAEKDPLLQVGTRYDHYTELIDKYLLAISRVKATYERFPNASDYQKWARYEAFVRIMREEMDKLGNIETKIWPLRNFIETTKPKVSEEVKKEVLRQGEALRKKYGDAWERKPETGRPDSDGEEDEPGFARRGSD